MNKRIIQGRVRAIRRLLSKKRIQCLIITKSANVSYMTGFSGEDSWAVIGPKTVYLVTDSRYMEQAQGECHYCKIIERKGVIADSTAELVKGLKGVRVAGVESSSSVAVFEGLRKKIKKRLRPAENIVEQMRIIKDGGEIAAIRKAAGIAGLALKNILKSIKAGMTENQLAGLIDFQIRKLGEKIVLRRLQHLVQMLLGRTTSRVKES